MTTDEAIGARVHQEMWRQRITQVKLAAMLEMTQSAVSKKVHGERPWFASELLAVSRVLGVPITALYGLEPVAPEPDPALNSG